MAKVGFDAVMSHGIAEDPLWIEIGDQGIFFHSAQQIWGKDTFYTEDQINSWIKENRPQAGKCKVVCIGPAGEKLVNFAVIENDYWRSAGRTGVGAVMGSKKIKAIAFWGSRKKTAAQPDKVKAFTKELAQQMKNHPGAMAYKNLGTPMMVDTMNAKGCFPTSYWQKGRAQHPKASMLKRCTSAARSFPMPV